MGVINPAQFKFGSRLHEVLYRNWHKFGPRLHQILDLDLDTNLGQGYTKF